jgi:hypothetical protein
LIGHFIGVLTPLLRMLLLEQIAPDWKRSRSMAREAARKQRPRPFQSGWQWSSGSWKDCYRGISHGLEKLP